MGKEEEEGPDGEDGEEVGPEDGAGEAAGEEVGEVGEAALAEGGEEGAEEGAEEEAAEAGSEAATPAGGTGAGRACVAVLALTTALLGLAGLGLALGLRQVCLMEKGGGLGSLDCGAYNASGPPWDSDEGACSVRLSLRLDGSFRVVGRQMDYGGEGEEGQWKEAEKLTAEGHVQLWGAWLGAGLGTAGAVFALVSALLAGKGWSRVWLVPLLLARLLLYSGATVPLLLWGMGAGLEAPGEGKEGWHKLFPAPEKAWLVLGFLAGGGSDGLAAVLCAVEAVLLACLYEPADRARCPVPDAEEPAEPAEPAEEGLAPDQAPAPDDAQDPPPDDQPH